MTDITQAQLVAKISDPSVANWWNSAPPLPSGVDVAEFFAKNLLALYVAAEDANRELAAEVRINNYIVPSSGTPTVGTNGLISSVVVFSCRMDTPLDLNGNVFLQA